MEPFDPNKFELATTILARANELTLATVRADGSPHASTVNFAGDGLVLYAAISIDGGKAHDLSGDDRVALTVNAPYDDWSGIQGMSIDGHAAFVTDPTELSFASALLLQKLPGYERIIAQPHVVPWPGMLFIRITPERLALLDYTKGFGHTELFDLRNQDAENN
ncbi:MAG: pyridoxamine 5'-phosphate oxidase family protein [Pseudomonadota bacterium]|nr:pyridoxamine 5'-phosphate oxidase family protein [Pseudomonadota bacterium]